MDCQPLLGDEKSPLTPPPISKEDPELAAGIDLETQHCRRQCQIRKRKCRRRFFHFLTITVVLGLVLWVRHGGAAGTMSSVKGFFRVGEGDDDHDHPIHIPRRVTLLKCTNWDGQDDLPPSPDSPYPLPLESLSSLFPSGNPHKANARGGCHGLFRHSHKDERNVDGLLPVLPRTSPITSSAEFTFPLNNTQEGEENKFFFMSRGWWSAGRVNVFQKSLSTLRDDHQGVRVKGEPGEVKVHVDFSYEHENYLEYVKVCKISVNLGKEGEEDKLSTGVGIFTPDGHRRRRRHPHPHPQPFEVTIEFPEVAAYDYAEEKESKPITITQFISDMPLFSQTFGDLKNVYFDMLAAASANQPLESQWLWGSNLIFGTSNAPISGKFKALKSAILVTKNAPLEADIELVHDGSSANSTFADLVTVNGCIKANTTLTSTSEDGTGGNFTVGLATVKAPIVLTFPSAPINNTLYLGASTVLSPVNVTLHPTYEGTFSLKTILSPVTLNAKRDPEGDPEGKGRWRGLEVFHRGFGKLDGETWWNEARKKSGHVKIESTLAPIVLDL